MNKFSAIPFRYAGWLRLFVLLLLLLTGPISAQAQGKKWALVVGIDKYESANITTLDFAVPKGKVTLKQSVSSAWEILMQTKIPGNSAEGKFKKNAKDDAEMVLIPAGGFTMGGDIYGLAHQVTLDRYYIYKKLVTVGQYKKFCEATGKAMPFAPLSTRIGRRKTIQSSVSHGTMPEHTAIGPECACQRKLNGKKRLPGTTVTRGSVNSHGATSST